MNSPDREQLLFSASMRLCVALLLAISVFTGVTALGFVSNVYANAGDEGSASGVFLKVDPGARSTALGSAYVAAPADPYSVQFNPAVFADVSGQGGGITRLDVFQGVSYHNVSFVSPLAEENGSFGINANMMDYGSQQRSLIDPGSPTSLEPVTGQGRFSADDMELSFGWGKYFTNDFAGGASLKYVEETIGGFSANTYSLDLGGRYRVVQDHLWLGAAGRNIIGDLQLNRRDDPLPAVFDFGLFYTRPFPNSNMRLNAGFDYVFPEDADAYASIGAELGFWDMAFMRLGFKGDQEADNGLTIGAGFAYGKFKVDYSIVEFGNLGRHQKLSLSYDFGPTEPTKTSIPAKTEDKNQRPEIQSELPDPVGKEDGKTIKVDLSQYGMDPDGDTLTRTVYGGSKVVNATLTEEDMLILEPRLNQNGTERLTIALTDGEYTLKRTMKVTLKPVNDPPRIKTPVPRQKRPEDHEPWTLSLEGRGADVDDKGLTWSVTSDKTDEIDVSLSAKTLTFTPKPNAFGEGSLTLALTDGTDTVTQTVEVELTPVNDAPYIKPPVSDQFGKENQDPWSVGLHKYANDIDDDQLKWSVDPKNVGFAKLTVEDGDTLSIRPKDDSTGTETVTLLLSDGAARTTQDITVSLRAVNAPPQINPPVPAQRVSFSGTTAVDLQDHEKDPDGDELRWTVNKANELQASVSDKTLWLQHSVTSGGSESILLTLSDGMALDTQYLDVSLEPNPEPDTVPLEEQNQEAKKEFKALLGGMAVPNIPQSVFVEVKNGIVVVGVSSDILFDLGKENPLEGSRDNIRKVADILNKYPDRDVLIGGHTDDLKISPTSDLADKYSDNWELSKARAVTVAEMLIKEYGFDVGRLGLNWFADNDPRVPNNSSKNRLLNRRVEIKLLPPDVTVAEFEGYKPATSVIQ